MLHSSSGSILYYDSDESNSDSTTLALTIDDNHVGDPLSGIAKSTIGFTPAGFAN